MRVLAYGAGLIVSVLPAFLLVFVSLFADGQTSERLLMLLAVIPVYVLIGFLFGRFVRPHRAAGTAVIALPAVLLIGWLALKEEGGGLLLASFLLVVIGSAYAGVHLGVRRGTRPA